MHSYTLATAAALAALAAAQSASPSPTSTGAGAVVTSALPFFFPFGATIAGNVLSTSGDQTALAITCKDQSGCPQPSTALYLVGPSTVGFKYGDTGFECAMGGDTATCTKSADGTTTTSNSPVTELRPSALPTSEGIPQAVVISGVSGSSGSSMPSATGSSSGSSAMPSSGSSTMSPSGSASSSSASPSSSAGANAAEHLVAGTGFLGAAALLAGAIIA